MDDKTHMRATRERLQSELSRVEAWLAIPDGGDADTYGGRVSDAGRRAYFERRAKWLREELER